MEERFIFLFGRKLTSIAAITLALALMVSCSEKEEANGDASKDGGKEEPDGNDDGEEGEDDDREGEPIELVAFARLNADKTRTSGFSWPREAEDALATVRDDAARTGYKPALEEDSVIEIDLMPLFGKQVSLHNFSMTFEGRESPNVKVALYDYCGGKAKKTYELSEGGSVELEGQKAGCVTAAVYAEEKLSVSALSLLSRDASIESPELNLEGLSPEGIRHKSSGVIEGFYGIPWSWREREAMIVNMAQNGLGVYIYAPKNDPLHRSEWRGEYEEADMKRFGELAKFADTLGITLYFGISPLIDFDFEEEGDYKILLDKLLRFVNVGLKGFVLLADDIEMETSVDASYELGASHAALANRLLSDLRAAEPKASLWFVPTVYEMERITWWEGGLEYLEALRELHEEIEIMWTGNGVSNSLMKGEDMKIVTETTGRKPAIWDNFYANDGGDGFKGRVLLAPFSGRSSDLQDAVSGILHNLSIQGSLSRLALSTFGYYMENPGKEDLAAARKRAAEFETRFSFGVSRDDKRDIETINYIMEVFDGHAQKSVVYSKMESEIDKLTAIIDAGGEITPEDIEPLLNIYARMASIESEIHHSGLDAGIIDELIFPMKKIRYEGETGLYTLLMLLDKLTGGDGRENQKEAREALTRSRENRFTLGEGKNEALFNVVRALEPRNTKLKPIAVEESEFKNCEGGKEFALAAFSSAERASLYGFKGARYEGGKFVWKPRYGGKYFGVAIGINGGAEGGWGVTPIKAFCK